MESKMLMVVIPERMHRELAEYTALLSAKPLRSGRTREYRLKQALIMAAMLYIEEYLYQERRGQGEHTFVSSSPPG